ncbi:MAG TPA: hypothetical protein VNO33_09995 [Kofleriaceae bacterium]|nr:hypothetical protein [Kofleriaceae bacterium]
MRRTRISASFALWLLAACSGGGGNEPAAPEVAPAEERTTVGGGEQAKERKLRAAQDSAVAAMCERLVDCAVESAHANMSPEEVAKLDLEKTAPRLREECEDEGGRSSLSPRQVRVIQDCVTSAESCDRLQTCLEQAKKQPAAEPAAPGG